MDKNLEIIIDEIVRRYFSGMSYKEAYDSVIEDIKKDGISHLIYIKHLNYIINSSKEVVK